LAKWVINTYNSKQAPPKQISNIEFTAEQLTTLQTGKAVKVDGLEIKKGEYAGNKVDRWITWDNNTGKCHFHETEPKSKEIVGKKQAETSLEKQSAKQSTPSKKKGIKI
jgi:hypothetical protein